MSMQGKMSDYWDGQNLGKKFGDWTVIGVGYKTSRRSAAYVCRCKCGEHSIVPRARLLRDLSHGCMKCYGGRVSGERNSRWAGYKNLPKDVYSVIVRNAEARGIKVLVTMQELQELYERQGGKCALTGLPIKLGPIRYGREASLDRIDSSKDYTLENVQWVHKDVNRMKNKFDEDYFLRMCRAVAEHRGAVCQTH